MQLCKLVVTVLGIGKATVAQVIAEGNKSENKQLTAPKLPGRPRKELKPNVSEVIRDLVSGKNLRKKVISFQNGSCFEFYMF